MTIDASLLLTDLARRVYVVLVNDIHMTRLVQWVIHRLGLALFWSLAAATVCGVLAAVTQQVGWLYVAGFAAPLAAAFTLVASRAPLPDLEDADAEG